MEKTTITSGDRKRTETGVIQFNQDWPGVFLRGDDAFGYAMSLLAVIAQQLAQHDEEVEPDLAR